MTSPDLPEELFGTSAGDEVATAVRQAWQAVAGTVTAMRAEGKAIGVVASRDIDAGECVLQERPLLTLTPDGAGRYDGRYNGREPEQAKALLATLSAARPGAGTLGSVIETNGIVVGHGTPDAFTAIHLLISRCNHSCRPNAAFSWDAASGVGRLLATRPIASGAAVEFNYGASGSRARRQRRLLQRFHFECGCELCALSGAAREASDAHEEAKLWGGLALSSDEDEVEAGEVGAPGTAGRPCDRSDGSVETGT